MPLFLGKSVLVAGINIHWLTLIDWVRFSHLTQRYLVHVVHPIPDDTSVASTKVVSIRVNILQTFPFFCQEDFKFYWEVPLCTSRYHIFIWAFQFCPRLWFNQSINQYVFQDFLQGYCWQVIWLITVNNPRTDIGKPVFMTDLQMHWYRLCDNILESNDTIQYNILGIEIENEKNRQI